MDLEICSTCFGARWLSTARRGELWPHNDCAAPAKACPECNTGERPEFGPDSVALIEVDEDDE